MFFTTLCKIITWMQFIQTFYEISPIPIEDLIFRISTPKNIRRIIVENIHGVGITELDFFEDYLREEETETHMKHYIISCESLKHQNEIVLNFLGQNELSLFLAIVRYDINSNKHFIIELKSRTSKDGSFKSINWNLKQFKKFQTIEIATF